jgi:hypothetical protein
VNKEHIQSKLYLKKVVFSGCGLFAVNSGVCGGKASLLGRLPGLLGTVPLPRFGLVDQFSFYPVPYEWLRDDKTPDGDADEGQARNSQSTSVFQYNQHNTIRIFGPSVLYRLLVDKRVWNVSDRFSNDPSTPESADKEWASINDLVNPDAVMSDSDKASMSYVNGLITFDPKKKVDKPMTSGFVNGLFSKVRVNQSKGAVQLHRKLLGNTAAATTSDPIGANTLYTDTVHANTRAIDQTHLSNVLQQTSIQRTIKTLATKNTEEQSEHKAQFELLQQQLKGVEQLTSQDMRRLQQSVQELKHILSARQQPASFSSPRPPSFYGRLK